MPPSKRPASDVEDDQASDGEFAPGPSKPVAKKPRATKAKATTTANTNRTLAELEAMSHSDLAAYAFQLQTQLSGGEWTPEKIQERINKTADICRAEIKKQMKWQPSCKQGTTKWSYTAVVPHEDVFYGLFGIEKGGKAWKTKKVPLEEFRQKVGHISASIRYGSLRLTGTEVRVTWNKEEKTFTVSGTYGL